MTQPLDFPRAGVRLLTAVRNGSTPLPVATGRIESLDGMTETLVRVTCRGRDAYLEPLYEAGIVTYLPGDDPLLVSAPVPDPMCVESELPDVVPGDPPAEPPPLPDPIPGPEPPGDDDEEETGDGGGGLPGAYIILLRYRAGVPPDEPTWVKETEVIGPLPSAFVAEACPGATPGHFFARGSVPAIGGSQMGTNGLGEFYHYVRRFSSQTQWVRIVCCLYRGPNVGGLNMKALTTCSGLPGVSFDGSEMRAGGIRVLDVVESAETLTTIAKVRLARYTATGILNIGHLNALQIASPAEGAWNSLLPTRIETLVEQQVSVAATQPANALFHVGPLSTGATIPLTQATGPSLLVVELDDDVTWGGGVDDSLYVNLFARWTLGGSPAADDSPSIA